ncbi:MAG: rhomboid family intramembrane serine protease [Bacteroidetes bacterium]|nr:rhomboid family intramembrane serine protease [Bacteroidota bacterium]
MGLLYLFKNMPTAVKNIFIINILFFLGAWISQEVLHYNMTYELGMKYFGSVLFKPFQIFTHMFIHGSFSHILFNMFGLLMFGSMIERYIGTKRFLILYLMSGLGSALLEQSYWAYRVSDCVGNIYPDKGLQHDVLNGFVSNSVCQDFIRWIATPMVGASGAIYGLLVAYGMFFPNSELMFIFIPYPIKAKYMIPGIILLDLFLGLSSFNWDNVAHFAHLGGALTGFILIKIWNQNRTRLY